MLLSKTELYNDTTWNDIYSFLFSTFLSGIKKNHKMEYYSFDFAGKTFKGRAVLPTIEVDESQVKNRAYEMFRIEYEETKCYPNYLISKHFPEVFQETYNEILNEEVETETEIRVDNLVDSIINKYFQWPYEREPCITHGFSFWE